MSQGAFAATYWYDIYEGVSMCVMHFFLFSYRLTKIKWCTFHTISLICPVMLTDDGLSVVSTVNVFVPVCGK